MSHIMKKSLLSVTLLLLVALTMLTVIPVAAEPAEDTISIKVRIEGVSENLYYDTVTVPYTDALTVLQFITYLNETTDLVIEGLEASYISSVNGESQGTFGGWDGWLYEVNHTEPTVGMGQYGLKDGDTLLLYFGDPYGVGMQFPEVDTTRLQTEGVLRFVSGDTAVADATVTWGYGEGKMATYVTDANGEICIDAAQLTKGDHSLQIAKNGTEAGGKYLPLVLRFAPDYIVTVEKGAEGADETTTRPATGDPMMLAAILLTAMAGMGFWKCHKKYAYLSKKV